VADRARHIAGARRRPRGGDGGFPILALSIVLWRWEANTERERAALVLGGTLAVDSPQGGPTTIVARFPCA
jgi:hypothetical protein